MPLFAWKQYQTQRATEQEIRDWWKKCPDANIGIVTGSISGLAVVDLDSEDALKFVEANGGIDTPFVKTGKGYHAYFKFQDGIRNFQKKANLPDIDLRGEGGYVVAPPSIHESGHAYKWINSKGLGDLPLADLPSWILAERPEDKQPITELYRGCEKGGRNNGLARLVGSWLNDGLSYGACLKNADKWNEKNNPPLSFSEVEGTVSSIMRTHTRNNSSPTKIDWPEPISLPDGLLPVQKLDEMMIPEPLRGWIADMAERMQVPPDFMTAAAIVAAASVIGRGCGIYPKRKDDWLVVPNHWGAVVSPPSLLKSPAISAALGPLDRLIYDANEEYRQKMKDCEFELSIMAAKKDSLKTELKKALKTNDKAQIERLRSEDKEVEPPRHTRFATQDGTTEKIGEILVDNPRGLLVKRDELIAFLKSLDKQGREGDRGFYLESWNGTGRFTVDRIGRGTLDVPALCVSIFGAITPGPLSPSLTFTR